MKYVRYIKGDATNPIGDGKKIIIHCCNSIGGWGSGFVLAISRKWEEPERQYRLWSKGFCSDIPFEHFSNPPFKLGEVQFVKAEKDIVVANMIGQEGVGFVNGIPPVRYDALDSCLKKVSEVALKYKASVHSPRFGAGLAGGDWDKIEGLIIDNLCSKDIEVTVYDYEPK